MKIMSRRFVVLTISSLLGLLSAILLGSFHSASAQGSFPSQVYAPYQDVTLGPTLKSVAQKTGQKYFTLAFITNGGSCTAAWSGTVPLNQTSTFLPHLTSDISYIRSTGGDVSISFGGAAGTELALACSSASSLQKQYQSVINAYKVTHLDFDIEGGTEGDTTSYNRRNTALAALQKANPGLVISFTLPSATTGLLSDSIGLLNNAKAKGVNFSIVNLMTMDYGGPDSHMGQDSINAANGLFNQLKAIYPSKTTGQLWSLVGLTNLIGQNDTPKEIFTLSDAQKVLTFAQQKHIGELSIWEVSRDNGSCPGSTSDQDTCSGLSQSAYAFTNIFKTF
ncbi:MAG TPA: chitinase [Ktedonobacteraceae bacterium]|nr:chitinase [Ktedonobacteraceae bacterium]